MFIFRHNSMVALPFILGFTPLATVSGVAMVPPHLVELTGRAIREVGEFAKEGDTGLDGDAWLEALKGDATTLAVEVALLGTATSIGLVHAAYAVNTEFFYVVLFHDHGVFCFFGTIFFDFLFDSMY